jgi:hypothetical protein
MTLTAGDRTDALAERLFAATLGALELYSVYLGAELGLYRTLAEHGPLTADELAERAGIAPRYAVEWLEQQAVAGLLDVEHPDAAAGARRYRLAPEHARVLVESDDPLHVAPFAHMLAGIGGVLPRVADAYRTGGGVAYEGYGNAFRHGQGHINRPTFTKRPPDRLAGGAARRQRPPSPSRRPRGRPRLRPGLVQPRDRARVPPRAGRRPRPRPRLDRRRHPPRR